MSSQLAWSWSAASQAAYIAPITKMDHALAAPRTQPHCRACWVTEHEALAALLAVLLGDEVILS